MSLQCVRFHRQRTEPIMILACDEDRREDIRMASAIDDRGLPARQGIEDRSKCRRKLTYAPDRDDVRMAHWDDINH